MSDSDRVYQPARVVVGHCPECARVVVVLNDHEGWPYIDCECGASFPTDEIATRIRYERGAIAK